jgi:hypothetical protein
MAKKKHTYERAKRKRRAQRALAARILRQDDSEAAPESAESNASGSDSTSEK